MKRAEGEGEGGKREKKENNPIEANRIESCKADNDDFAKPKMQYQPRVSALFLLFLLLEAIKVLCRAHARTLHQDSRFIPNDIMYQSMILRRWADSYL